MTGSFGQPSGKFDLLGCARDLEAIRIRPSLDDHATRCRHTPK